MDKIIEVIARSEEQAVDCNDDGGACSSEEDAEEANAPTSDVDWQDARRSGAEPLKEGGYDYQWCRKRGEADYDSSLVYGYVFAIQV